MVPPGLERPDDEPDTPVLPDDVKLPRGMRAELKGIPWEMAEVVAAHLWMAGELVDVDPELAFRHAEAARRRAARLPVTREASAETAYAAQKYDQALSQYKALRRITGSNDYIPVIADCLRALKKYREALEIIEEGKKADLEPAMAVELLIVQAGVRVDMSQSEEAMRLLRSEIERPTMQHPRVAQARLLYAYADLLSQAGDLSRAYRGFAAAAKLDIEQTTAALDRLDELDGVTFEIDQAEFDTEFPVGEDDEGGEGDEGADSADVEDEAEEYEGIREVDSYADEDSDSVEVGDEEECEGVSEAGCVTEADSEESGDDDSEQDDLDNSSEGVDDAEESIGE